MTLGAVACRPVLVCGVGQPQSVHVRWRRRHGVRKQRWLAYGRTVIEVDHEFVRSIYTNDPDGTFVEWTYNVRALNEADRIEAERLLLDDSPSDQPGEAAIFHSPPVAV